VNKATPHWYCGSDGDFYKFLTNCTHALWAQTANPNNASDKSKGHLEKYNESVVPVDFVAAIMFSMLDPHLSKGVINNTHNRGPSATGKDGAPTHTNFNNHDSRANTKRKKGFFLSRRERE
jgi:hypothetical protein